MTPPMVFTRRMSTVPPVRRLGAGSGSSRTGVPTVPSRPVS
ncbi:hypothetical protein [Streptomyces bobili]|uniref:Uncharacterized protein n=1 Tax=Streptomyces bobili TaxID=67280 RepID=A0ABZ1R4F8_9ACTN|nr:hypothetical protein [Streptomyces bobili]